MTTPPRQPRWYHLTPDRFFAGLLAAQVFLFLSERFQWFAFNEHKGWTVLIAVGVVGSMVLVMLVWGLVCLLLRRRFQFGVRSLLVLVTAVAIPCSWTTVAIRQAQNQKKAVAAIESVGASVSYDWQVDANLATRLNAQAPVPAWLRQMLGDDFFTDVVVVIFYGDKLTDMHLRHLEEFAQVQWLDIRDTKVTDAGLEHLRGLTQLQLLKLSRTQITDVGVNRIRGLTRLQELYLCGTQVTDTGLEHVRAMTQLLDLNLGNTKITDAGLDRIRGLIGLELLNLGGTQVTDDGLVHLEQLTRLRELYLDDTQVTHKGVKELQEMLPNCEIVR